MGWFNNSTPENIEEENGNFSASTGGEAEEDELCFDLEKNEQHGVWFLGSDNEIPKKFIHLFDASPTNQSVINKTGKMIAGESIIEELNSERFIDRIHLTMLMQYPNPDQTMHAILREVGQDAKQHGRYALECRWNIAHDRIVEIRRVDVGGVCPSIAVNENGKPKYYCYSDDWDDYNCKVKYYPRLDKNGKGNRQLLVVDFMRSGHKVFGLPDYYASIDWIEIEAGTGKSHKVSVRDGFSPKVAVIFPGKPDSTKIEDRIVKKLNKNYAGVWGRRIMAIFAPNKGLIPEIQQLDVKNLHDQYTTIDSQAERKILTGHGVTTPLLFGINPSNGFGSNAMEMTEGFNIYQRTSVGPYQDSLNESLAKIMRESSNTNRLLINPFDYSVWSSSTRRPDEDQEIDNTNAINSLSPLVATKVLDNLTVNEIRSLGGLPAIDGGDVIKSNEKNEQQ